MRVDIGPEPRAESSEVMTADDMVNLQRDFNLSQKAVVGIATTICKGLIDFVKEERGIKDVLIKIGCDGGRGSLKICSSIQEISDRNLDPTDEPKAKKRKQVRSSKQFSDSGVKKTIVIGSVEFCPENRENILKMWELIGINKIIAKYAVDFKVANLSSGIGSHSSLFLCTWCFSSKDELHKGNTVPRTIAKIKEYSSQWRATGVSFPTPSIQLRPSPLDILPVILVTHAILCCTCCQML
ncbi:hypothetical protein QAD02_020462 [Eretmocerus hayati]|uniref:Uncharacterized protein n=1 Tax=Eretmocerus hayati TaxID=131215 RepID=A0ACC2PM65_9HYME|nr:hypothetical protein QAD02_020462 [Eretmocerus hayati]